MGKQKGDAARSKTRPSSSNLAASLLQSGTTSVGFGGYVGSARLDLTSTNDPTSLTDVDGEVAQHLRRLSKRDPTTKVKALASLSILFKENSASELSQIVPQWVFEYKRLVQDNSKHVRQATHDAMANLVATIGRGLAPHLRSLMGAWWLAQFDPFNDVSEVARRSFQVAFPAQEKRLEALIFCGNEIFAYLDENLKLTPHSISDKTAPIEELEEMHQRVVSSSLLALASLLDVLLGPLLQSPAHQNVSSDDHTDLKNAGKARAGAILAAERICHSHRYFQGIVKSHSSRVRLAVYKVLGTFVKCVPQVYSGGDLKIISGIVLGSFQEKDPTCHSSMWDMLLLFTRKFPEAWSAGPIYKVILPHFWRFLRNGCYGSQQTSYPCLLPLLASIPPASIHMEQLFIDFFQNLWAGKDVSLASYADQGALFKAIKECLFWVINNASSYFEEREGHIEQCRVRLVEDVIFKLLWLDYVSSGKSNTDAEALSDKYGSLVASNIKNSKEKPHNKPTPKYPKNFVRDLGRCIIEILSNIYARDANLLQAFVIPFQIECLKIIQQVGNNEELCEGKHCIDQISEFFLLLGAHSKNEKGDNWPLLHIARPFFAKSFPVIKYMGLPAAVNLLSVIISAFGPRMLPFEAFIHVGVESHVQFYPSENDESKPEPLLDFFKSNLVTWCLNGHDHSTSSRLDLLLAFLEDAYFQSQWDWILAYAAELEDETAEIGGRCLNIDRVTVLAILMEKVRHKFIDHNVLNKSNLRLGFEAKHWHSRRLDDVAVAVAHHNVLRHPSCVRLLWSVLGGATQEDIGPLISKEAVNLIFDQLLKHLLSVLIESSISWANSTASLILSSRVEECLQASKALSTQTSQVAKFAAEVLDGSFFCLKVLDGDTQVVPHILAVVFCLHWENRIGSQTHIYGGSVKSSDSDEDARDSDNDDNGAPHSIRGVFDECSIKADEGTACDASPDLNDSKSDLIKSVHVLWSRTIASSLKSFSSLTLQRLKWVLIESIRHAVFEEQTVGVQEIAAVSTEWVMEIMDHTCKDQDEQQQLLEQLLSSNDAWPLWAEPPLIGESKNVTLKSERIFSELDKDRHARFVIFVDRIGSLLGQDKLFIRPLINTSHMSAASDLRSNESGLSSCRIWLAIEILCTWKWPGGSAMQSLLPFLCECAQNGTDHIEQIMVDSIINILFMGALNNSAARKTYALNIWVVSDDEVDKIEEPFLRALVMLLTMLFKNGSIWAKADAYRVLFDHFLNHGFLNPPAVNGYLNILPNILNVLVPILRKRIVNSEKIYEDFSLEEEKAARLQDTTCQWLQNALSGPPLILCEMEQPDVEEWIRVAVSCFPLSHIGGMAAFAMASSFDVSPDERALLLALFQKQASKEALSGYHAIAAERRASLITVLNGDFEWEATIQLTLAKLMAVAVMYCWEWFGENEWVFVLTQLRRWLESAVRHMEELAEGVDNTVKNVDVGTSLAVDSILENVEKAVLKSRLCCIDVAEMAIFIFSLICGLHNQEGTESTASLDALNAVNWERAEARALEDILRLFFATGITESVALSSCAGEKAGAVIALSRQSDGHFWEKVAEAVLSAPSRAREAAVHAAELWGLGKGAISALYAVLFSNQPIPALQWAAYHFLSTNPLQPLAVTNVVLSSQFEESIFESEDADPAAYMNSSVEESSLLRPELAHVMQTPLSELLGSHSTAHIRVQYLLAWSLFLTRLQGMPSLSEARERLVQYAQDSGSSSALLDFLFQYIPLKQSSAPGSKKKGTAAVVEATSAATAAKRAAETTSLSFAVEALWPVGIDEISALAGAIYGLMLRVLPAYVRDWFTSLRDRTLACSIEAFTTAWCSPQLLADEFSQIQAAGIADESLSIKANRSTREVTAIYKKEEAGMDVVIRLPSCYPLRVVDVDCTRKLGISETRLRKWMLSMAAFVRNQNGAIAEAIHIWNRNVDREFDGVEECPICYSIIHTTNHSLPRLACKTCKHKFHSACLYKWFSTSHKSTCPLCQTPF